MYTFHDISLYTTRQVLL